MLFFILFHCNKLKLCAFVYVTMKQLFMIDFSSWVLPLFAMKRTSKGKTYLLIIPLFPVHGKYNCEICSSVHQSSGKLQSFL